MPARMLEDLPFSHVQAKMLQACFLATLKGMCPKVSLVFCGVAALLTDEYEEWISDAQWPLEDKVAPATSIFLGLFERQVAIAPDFCTLALSLWCRDYSKAVIRGGAGWRWVQECGWRT